MFKNRILSSPYNFEYKFPQEKTAEFLLNLTSQHCKNGLGKTHWITDTETGEFITFSEIEPLSRQVASSLFKRGMRRGDILLYSSHHPTKLHVFFLGVWRANGVVRAIYPQENKSVIAEKIIESNARFYLCDPETVPEVTAAIENVPWPVEVIVFGQAGNCTSADTIFEDLGDACPALEVGGDDMAVILSTSGTTGASKGVVYTHSGIIKTIVFFQKSYLSLDNCNPFLAMGKQTHISGFRSAFTTLVAGGTTLTFRNVTKENIFQAVHQYKPSLVHGFPKYLLCLANDEAARNYDLSSIRYILMSGVVITPGIISTMKSLPRVQVIIMYGMTESFCFVTSKNCEALLEGQENNQILQDVPDFSSGKLAPGTSLQVRDLETNNLLGQNQRGELYFKSPLLCAGYFKRSKQEHDEAFPNGWTKTGDVGYFDENGFIFVVGRCKETFKYYNNHISPSELENVISCHDAVDSVCVVGVPDPEGGDTIPRAFVTLKHPHTMAEDILKFANDNLPTYKHLRGGLIVLPELPVGKTGKVNRDILSKMRISTSKINAS